MSNIFERNSLFRIYIFPVTVSLILLSYVLGTHPFGDFITILILAGLELTFSFDNAIVNAKILAKMSYFWQQLFMTVGIIIAVFGVRLLLPILIVSISAGLGFGEVINMSLNNPDEYYHYLELAHPSISAFGGIFLLALFLDYIFESREIKWLAPLETHLQKLGKLENVTVIICLSVLLFFVSQLSGQPQIQALIAGIIGLVLYLAISSLDSAISKTKHAKSIKSGSLKSTAFKAGLISFLYLELIDASFSLDGVIGAFAITNSIVLIAIGLAIGALFVRAMTIHILHKGVLGKFIYMEHGAHYAIGLLAIMMLISLTHKLPEALTGLTGITVIIIAIIHSVIESKKKVN